MFFAEARLLPEAGPVIFPMRSDAIWSCGEGAARSLDCRLSDSPQEFSEARLPPGLLPASCISWAGAGQWAPRPC
jgi:hypothetical protein